MLEPNFEKADGLGIGFIEGVSMPLEARKEF